MVAASEAAGKKLLVGYILQVHPSWTEFIAQAQALGSPKVMRLNLNQQDKTREKWDHHLQVCACVVASPLATLTRSRCARLVCTDDGYSAAYC